MGVASRIEVLHWLGIRRTSDFAPIAGAPPGPASGQRAGSEHDEAFAIAGDRAHELALVFRHRDAEGAPVLGTLDHQHPVRTRGVLDRGRAAAGTELASREVDL